jgi:hypothetical protein
MAWVEEGHMTLLQIIPHRARLSRVPLYNDDDLWRHNDHGTKHPDELHI